MTTRRRSQTQLTIWTERSVLHLRLRIRVRTLLALLTALAVLSGSPALIAALARLGGG